MGLCPLIIYMGKMRTIWRFSPLLLLGLFASCSSTSTALVPPEGLRPSSSPNIEQLELKNGQLIVFNSDLGWYDAEHAYIEGVDMLGARDTIPLSQVKQAQIPDVHTNPFLNILLTVLAIGVVGGLALWWFFFGYLSHNGQGCLVLLAVLGTSMVTATAIFIL